MISNVILYSLQPDPIFIHGGQRYLMVLPEQDSNHGYWKHIAMVTTPVSNKWLRLLCPSMYDDIMNDLDLTDWQRRSENLHNTGHLGCHRPSGLQPG